MKKKELNAEELKNANGGGGDWGSDVRCPKCTHRGASISFNAHTVGDTCSSKDHYTCPKCGYEWEE